MNSTVIPAVTTPSSTEARNDFRVNDDGRGRTMISSSRAAQNKRSQAAPVAPISSINPTAMAAPTCTEHIAATAMSAPLRASLDATPAFNGARAVLSTSFPERRRDQRVRSGNGSLRKSICASGLLTAVTIPDPMAPWLSNSVAVPTAIPSAAQ